MFTKTEKITKEVLQRTGEKRKHLNSILRRITNWIRHILKRNCLVRDTIKGQMTKVKGVKRRRRMQLLDNLRKRNILTDKGGRLRSVKLENTVYHMNIGKKYKLSSLSSWTC